MAVRSIDDTVKDRLAQESIGCAYSAANTIQKAQIDEACRTAANKVNQVAQFFTLGDRTLDTNTDTVATADAYQVDIAEWFHWFFREAALILWAAYKKESVAIGRQMSEDAQRDAITAYTGPVISTSNLNGQTFTAATIRQYVLGMCVRRRRPIYPDVQTVDNCLQTVVNTIWNASGFPFRRRTITLVVTPTALSTATWTESSLTLTQTGAFTSYSYQAGDHVRITSGTGAVVGDYLVASRTSADAIVLSSSLSAAAGNLATGDIAGSLLTVRQFGLYGSESFDSFASRKLYFIDTTVSSSSTAPNRKLGDTPLSVDWMDADDAAEGRALTLNNVGMPSRFRMQSNAGVRSWRFYPFPDAAYTLFGEVFIKTPSIASSPSSTTFSDAFPAEFRPIIREWTLARVLTNYGEPSQEDHFKREADDLMHVYDEHGRPDDQQGVRDIYHDYGLIQGGYGSGAL